MTESLLAKPSSDTVAQVMADATALLPDLRSQSQQIELVRRLPPDLFDALRRAGCFRMASPVEHGGLGCTQKELFRMIELLATADASVAWIVMIFSSAPAILSRFPETARREAYAAGPDIGMAALLSPSGVATVVPGGYRVSGRWRWASGSEHADGFICTCSVQPQGWRLVWLKPTQVQRVDTWHVSGLRGTGSGDQPELQLHTTIAVWALQSATSVVDVAYHAGGGSSVWQDASLQRRFRDIHVATQHIAVADSVFSRHGAALMGGTV